MPGLLSKKNPPAVGEARGRRTGRREARTVDQTGLRERLAPGPVLGVRLRAGSFEGYLLLLGKTGMTSDDLLLAEAVAGMVAVRLFITEGTVKIHFHNIYQKLKINGRLELALYARDKGLV